jgi:hypothetical protein
MIDALGFHQEKVIINEKQVNTEKGCECSISSRHFCRQPYNCRRPDTPNRRILREGGRCYPARELGSATWDDQVSAELNGGALSSDQFRRRISSLAPGLGTAATIRRSAIVK